MLTGVCASLSTKTNDAWLSEDGWRAGNSKDGVSALLMGLEKLKDGLCSTDMSDAIDGDRWLWPKGDRMLLLVDILREPWETCEC